MLWEGDGVGGCCFVERGMCGDGVGVEVVVGVEDVVVCGVGSSASEMAVVRWVWLCGLWIMEYHASFQA